MQAVHSLHSACWRVDAVGSKVQLDEFAVQTEGLREQTWGLINQRTGLCV